MEISRMNPGVSGVVDKTIEVAPKRTAVPSESSASAEKSGNGNPSALDISKLENAISEQAQEGDATTEDFLHQLIDKVNSRLAVGNRMFDYSRHQKTGQLMVKIVNKETKEVIREIPPEKTLDAVARMWDMMGIFVDNKT